MAKTETYMLYNKETKWYGIACESCKATKECDGFVVTRLTSGDTANGLIQCEVCGIVVRYFTPSSNRH